MAKIEIKCDDGREIQISRGNYVFYKEADGKEHFWEWSHFSGREKDFDRVEETAAGMVRSIEAILPDIPLSAVR
ncbi:MAG: hypothetical protein R6U50_18245 [Desulfobacterales bacterium]